MSVTIFGQIATEDGTTLWVDTIKHTAPGGRLMAEQRRRYGTLRADEFDNVQPARVTVDIGHGSDELGELVYLERAQALTAVAVLDDLEPDDLASFGELKLSTQTVHDRISGSVQLRSVAVVKSADAAAIGLRPISWVPGDIRRGALNQIGIGQIPPLLKRAEEWIRDHRRDPLAIVEYRTPTELAAERAAERARRDDEWRGHGDWGTAKPVKYEMYIGGQEVLINRGYRGAKVLGVR